MTTSPDLRPALAPFPPTLSITTPGIPPPLAFSVTPNGFIHMIKISPAPLSWRREFASHLASSSSSILPPRAKRRKRDVRPSTVYSSSVNFASSSSSSVCVRRSCALEKWEEVFGKSKRKADVKVDTYVHLGSLNKMREESA